MRGSIRAYARHRAEAGLEGQSHPAVIKAISSGRIDREPDGSIDFEKADASWATKTTPTVTSRTTRHRAAAKPAHPAKVVSSYREPQAFARTPKNEDFAKARALKEGFLAGLAQIEYKKKTGELVPIADVEQEWGSIVAAIRNRLLLVPAKLATKLANLTDPREIEAAVAREIKESLIGLSSREDVAA